MCYFSIEELNLTKTDHDKMNHILNEKNSQLKYLRETLEQYEKDVAQMETRFISYSFNSELCSCMLLSGIGV